MKRREKDFKKWDTLKLHAYKHDGTFHRQWEQVIILEVNADYVIGFLPKDSYVYEKTKNWRITEPGIIYLHKKYWFNIIAMIRNDGVKYYCNLASPYVYELGCLKYIDYDLDIKVKTNLDFKVVDVAEFHFHKKKMNYPPEVETKVLENLEILKSWIENKSGPFNSGYPYYWYGVYGCNFPN